MQICSHCHAADNPDTVTFCQKCGKSPLRPYQVKFKNLTRSNHVPLSYHSLHRSSTVSTIATAPLVVATVALFLLFVLPSAAASPPPAPTTCLNISQQALTFNSTVGKNQHLQQIVKASYCGNAGAGTIATSFSTNDGAAWLDAEGEGKLDASNPLGINVSVNTQGLPVGPHTGQVTVKLTDTNGAIATQPVTINLMILSLSPAISTDQTALIFIAEAGSPPPDAQNVTVTNSGDEGTVSTHDGERWLNTTGEGQLASPGQLKLNIAVNTQGLPIGTYTGQVTVKLTDEKGATAPPKQITVTLTITKQCGMGVSQTEPTFTSEQGGNNPNPQGFTVGSSCPGTVTTDVSTDDGTPWLHADKRGQVDRSKPLRINVSVNTQGLSKGLYTGHVNVTFTDAKGRITKQPVTVTLTITPPCTISANNLSFTAENGSNNPNPQPLTVNKGSYCVGTGTVTTSGHGTSWLDADRGATPGNSPINIGVNIQGLSANPKPYLGSVTVTFQDANGVTATTTISVNLMVNPRTFTLQEIQSKTVKATGQRIIPATPAIGTIVIVKYDSAYTLHLPAGQPLPNTSGCTGNNLQISLDSPVDMEGHIPNTNDGNTSSGGTSDGPRLSIPPPLPEKKVSIHVVQPGKAGNIQNCPQELVYAFHYCVPTCGAGMLWEAYNLTTMAQVTPRVAYWGPHMNSQYHLSNPFLSKLDSTNIYDGFINGTDAQSYTLVLQSDIDAATKEANAAIDEDIKNHLRPKEHVVDKTCGSYKITPNPAVGNDATNVTVTVEATCTVSAST